MKIIDNSEHFFTCTNCNGDVDMRDLGQVFFHEGECLNGGQPKPTDFDYKSKKVGDSKEYLNGKTGIDLN